MRRMQDKNAGKAYNLTLFHRPCSELGVLCENNIAEMLGSFAIFNPMMS